MSGLKNFRCVVLETDGSFVLRDISFGPWNDAYTRLEPLSENFKCPLCETTGGCKGIQGPQYVQAEATFVLSYSDHTKDNECLLPVNPWSSKLLDISCSCGHEEHHSNYRGIFILIKKDLVQIKEDRKTKRDRDSTIDCTEEDLAFIRSKLTKKRPGSCCLL